MKKYPSDIVAFVCFASIILFLCFATVYKVGENKGMESIVSKNIYHLDKIPLGVPVLAIYDLDGIVTMVSAINLNDKMIIPYNFLGGSVPYDNLPTPKGWTDLPDELVEALR